MVLPRLSAHFDVLLSALLLSRLGVCFVVQLVAIQRKKKVVLFLLFALLLSPIDARCVSKKMSVTSVRFVVAENKVNSILGL